jgi:beta-glucosidase
LLLGALTRSQKIELLSGDSLTGVLGQQGSHTGTNAEVPGLVPRVNFTDGTAGIRQGQATAMPVEIAAAATFDPALARLDGSVLGAEARLKGNDFLFGPTLTIMRTPLAGRTFQGLGEDPLLAARQGVGLIDGIQAEGVIADANIYVANNQEGQDPTGQLGQPPMPLGGGTVGNRLTVNALVDERTLREIYLPPFEAAVKDAGVGTVMCAYNRVNGVYNCENGDLLKGVLERDWGFPGFVLSDYGATHDPVASLRNGLDFEPWPGLAYSPPAVTLALASGLVADQDIDEHVQRYLRTLFAFGVFDREGYVDDDSRIDKPGHAAASQRIAEGAITLLRNEGSVLPLDPATLGSIAVIGSPAAAFVTGGGSSGVKPFSTVTPLDAIAARAGGDATVSYADGTDASAAALLARTSDVAVVFAADYQTEGADKQCLSLECPRTRGDQDALIERVAEANPNTVVVLETGGPVLTPWRERVKGLVEAWYPGGHGGAAIARVLFGDVDPGGRLPVTFPRSEADLPTAGDPARYPGVAETVRYDEGVHVGYRWFDAHKRQPAYPFGFGLSYSRFDRRGLRATPAADGSATVAVTVTNKGRRRGIDVPQLYLGLPSDSRVPQPPWQLKDFRKITLAPGGSTRVSFRIDRRSLSHWDTGADAWRVTPGCYRVMVGGSSRDAGPRGVLTVGSAQCRGSLARIPQ